MSNKNSSKEMAQIIAKEIKKQYKTTEQFAYENDLSKGQLSEFLNGKRDIRLSTFLNLCKKLKINVCISK